jgi:hypothetical protein
MVTTTSRTNGDYWATTFINSGLTTQETMPYTDATTSYGYETNEVAKKRSKEYMTDTISKVCITHDMSLILQLQTVEPAEEHDDEPWNIDIFKEIHQSQ